MSPMGSTVVVLLLLTAWLAPSSAASAISGKKSVGKGPKIQVLCEPEWMKVQIVKPHDTKQIYLQHLKHHPDKACQGKLSKEGKMEFVLDLSDIFRCMVTKVVNKETGQKIYYHRIVFEYEKRPKQAVLVMCDTELSNSTTPVEHSTRASEGFSVVKRSAQFPSNFQEPDYDVEITSEVSGRAPIPELSIGVRRAGLLIDDELIVKPGTPLDMEIYLDDISKDIYGLMVSNMEVTDQKDQSETLIINGCTVDPYLFENFLTQDGNLLRARFKAFKFPDSNSVLFKGVVNVCLDKCAGAECANNEIGYGRKKRGADDDGSKPSRVYEVSMSTIITVDEDAAERSLGTRSAEKEQEPVTLDDDISHDRQAGAVPVSAFQSPGSWAMSKSSRPSFAFVQLATFFLVLATGWKTVGNTGI